MKLAGGDDTNVSVQVRERAGKIEVAVRSGDSRLNRSLQSNLSDLVARLDNRGYKTEAWAPAVTRQGVFSHRSSDTGLNQQREHTGSWSGREQRGDQGNENQRRKARPAEHFGETLAEQAEGLE